MDMTVTQDGDVAVVRWSGGENRLNVDSLGRLNQILDELATIDGPLALVLTGDGKFFCNGLDLERFGANPAEFASTLEELQRTIGRLMVFPRYTVAAINGHAFAGGALLSCAFDTRVMRVDRGYWCMNEAEIGLALDRTLFSILEHRLPRATAIDAAITARRFSAPEAKSLGIVEHVADAEDVLGRAVEIAQTYAGLNTLALGKHKHLAHGGEAAVLGFS
ncbi:MAG TPA: enoyl-CoA hydratase/isomerase family protein [Acidimicrobiales bacterium]|nr:enoyl-CoA hydratase/isomerase family protein [Acidimicrobiales bacterium]